jgi:hypothetical protein
MQDGLINAGIQAADVLDICANERQFEIVNRVVSIRAQMRSGTFVGKPAAGRFSAFGRHSYKIPEKPVLWTLILPQTERF